LSGGGNGTGGEIRWYTGACSGTPIGTGSSITVTPTATTVYYGGYWVPSPCVPTACLTVLVTVNQPPTDPTGITASPSSTICRGNVVSLTLDGGGGGTNAIPTWWTGSCNGTLVGTGNGFTVNPTTTTTYYGNYDQLSENDPCSASACASIVITVNDVELAVRVYLQGAMDCYHLNGTHPMTRYLTCPDVYIPTDVSTVYPGDGAGHPALTGTYTFSTCQQVVDWVWVGLRPAGDPDGSEFDIKAGILTTDGDIVAPGGGLLTFPNAYAGQSYYIVVGHRNHLGVESNNNGAGGALTFGCITSYDFTTGATQARNNGVTSNAPQVYMGPTFPGAYAMIAGDAGGAFYPSNIWPNGDGFVGSLDWGYVWYPQNGLLGYYDGDMNLDSSTDSFDTNSYWAPNFGFYTHVVNYWEQ